MEPIIAKLKTSTPLIEVKEEMEEPLTSEKSIKIEPLDDYVEEKEEGADLSHMDWDNGEKVEYVMYSKSILGEESTNVVPSTENAFSQDVDKARVEELQRRNKYVICYIPQFSITLELFLLAYVARMLLKLPIMNLPVEKK